MSDTATTEQLTQEMLPNSEGQVLKWLVYAGNDERKLEIILALSEANVSLGETGLMQKLNTLANKSLPGSPAAPEQFCRQSLSETGAVHPAEVEIMRFGKNPEIAAGHEITEEGKRFGIAFAGALLGWSLRHKELSLGKILGGTSGRYDVRAPLATYWTMYELATTPDSPKSPSITYVAEHIEMDDRTRAAAVDRLKEIGLVEKESSFENNRRSFKIVQPEYISGERKRPFENLSPETRLLFTTFKVAHAVKEEWTVDEFFRLAVALHPDADAKILKKARSGLYRAFSPSTTFLKGVVEDVGGRQYEGNTKVTLKPGVEEAVSELVSIIDALCVGDELALKRGRQQARKIIEKPEDFAHLYEKAYAASNLANRDPAMAARLLEIAKAAGRLLTTQQLREQYAETYGRLFSTRTVLNALKDLVASGELQQSERNVSVTKSNKRTVYGIVEARFTSTD